MLRSLPGNERERPDFEVVLDMLGRLWTQGQALDWEAIHGGSRRSRVHLPTYPFERSRHWIEPAAASAGSARIEFVPSALPQETIAMQHQGASPAGEASQNASRAARVRNRTRCVARGPLRRGSQRGTRRRKLSRAWFRFALPGPRSPANSIAVRRKGDLPAASRRHPVRRALAELIAAQLPAEENPRAWLLSTATPEAARAPRPLRPRSKRSCSNSCRPCSNSCASSCRHSRTRRRRVPSPRPTKPTRRPRRATRATLKRGAQIRPSRFEAFRSRRPLATEFVAEQRAHIADLVARTTSRTAKSKRAYGAVPAGLGRPTRRGGVPQRMEGDGLSHHLRSREGFALVGR